MKKAMCWVLVGAMLLLVVVLPVAYGKCGSPQTTWSLSLKSVTLVSGTATVEETENEISLWAQSGELIVENEIDIDVVYLYALPFVVLNYAY